jgi:stage IV sporulation protein B
MMMKLRGTKRISLFFIFIYIFSLLFSVSVNALFTENALPAFATVSDSDSEYTETSVKARDDVEISSRIYELFFGKQKGKQETLYLIPGGDVFGIRIKEENVTVSEAVGGSALKRGDKIISINGKKINNSGDVTEALKSCHGGAVQIDIIRGGEKMTLTVIPKYEDGAYRLGITLRKNACGIGTVTFIEPKTHLFGGLGHGVCDSESGTPIEISSGSATGVILGGVTRGEVGKPGELSGVLNKRSLGSIISNNECGVFGIMDDIDIDMQAPLPVGYKAEVHQGEAEIISTVKSGKKAKYKIEITEIDTTSTGSKSFKIKVKDPTLIALTGGIVRGMSGSPIIQNGKLVGAVTHVLVATPTEGYGIFIENMLNAAQNHVIPKAA